jgi:hypothetical protein
MPLSRFCATLLLATMDYVREDLLAKAKPLATRLAPGDAGCAVLRRTGALAFCPAEKARPAAGWRVATFWLAARFKRWLGGYTGDCLGATQQLSEIAFYLGLAGHVAGYVPPGGESPRANCNDGRSILSPHWTYRKWSSSPTPGSSASCLRTGAGCRPPNGRSWISPTDL